jgi:ABC-type sugar transport system substrate-binding protein
MVMGFIRRWSRVLLATSAAVAAAFAVAACGSSSDDNNNDASASASGSGTTAATSDPGLAEAKKSLEQHIKSPTSIGPTKPIGKPIPKGKQLVYVNCGAEACTNQGKGLQQAAKVLGWSVQVIQSQPTPQAVQASMTEALRRKPDAVISAGFSRALYARQIDQMTKAKIAVITSTGLEPTGVGGTTYNAEPPDEASRAMSDLADKTVVDLGGKGQIGAVYLTGYPLPKIYTDAYVARVKQVCPKCTIKSIDIQPTSIGKDAGEKIANFLRANPDMKAVTLSYDALGLGLPAAVKGAGLQMPKVYSYSPDAPGIQALKAGETTAAVPQPYNEIGWLWADALARHWTGGDVKDSQFFPNWVIWSKDYNNLPSDTKNPVIVEGYQDQFKKLWGIS